MQLKWRVEALFGLMVGMALPFILLGGGTTAGQGNDGRSVVVRLVECDAAAVGDASVEADVLRRCREGAGRTVFSCVLVPGGRRSYMDVRSLLVPIGFQCQKTSRGIPNPMNFARRQLGTRVSVQDMDARPVRFTLEREYVTGVEAARSSTPETFVEPVARTVRFEFDVPSVAGESVVGGGWREDAAGKSYYVIVSGAGL